MQAPIHCVHNNDHSNRFTGHDGDAAGYALAAAGHTVSLVSYLQPTAHPSKQLAPEAVECTSLMAPHLSKHNTLCT